MNSKVINAHFWLLPLWILFTSHAICEENRPHPDTRLDPQIVEIGQSIEDAFNDETVISTWHHFGIRSYDTLEYVYMLKDMEGRVRRRVAPKEIEWHITYSEYSTSEDLVSLILEGVVRNQTGTQTPSSRGIRLKRIDGDWVIWFGQDFSNPYPLEPGQAEKMAREFELSKDRVEVALASWDAENFRPLLSGRLSSREIEGQLSVINNTLKSIKRRVGGNVKWEVTEKIEIEDLARIEVPYDEGTLSIRAYVEREGGREYLHSRGLWMMYDDGRWSIFTF